MYRRGFSQIILLILLGFLALGGAGFAFKNKILRRGDALPSVSTSTLPITVALQTSSPTSSDNGLLFYENDEIGIQFDYPNDVTIQEVGNYEKVIVWPPQKNEAGTIVYPRMGFRTAGNDGVLTELINNCAADGAFETIFCPTPTNKEIALKKNQYGINYGVFYTKFIRENTDGEVVTSTIVNPNLGPFIFIPSIRETSYVVFYPGYIFWESSLPQQVLEDFQKIIDSLRILPFGGIGVEMSIVQEGVNILRVLEGSPASREGIDPGDIILKINGTSTAGMDMVRASKAIRGTPGTNVEMVIKHIDGSVGIYNVRREIIGGKSTPVVNNPPSEKVMEITLYFQSSQGASLNVDDPTGKYVGARQNGDSAQLGQFVEIDPSVVDPRTFLFTVTTATKTPDASSAYEINLRYVTNWRRFGSFSGTFNHEVVEPNKKNVYGIIFENEIPRLIRKS